MKHIRYHILIIALLFASALSFANSGLQEKAEKAYGDKNYKEAIQFYEAILTEGFISYKLYYNLGNAYYKNNELGKAIYNYELANKLEPNNQDVKTNLRIANSKTIDKIESKENFFIGALKASVVNALSTTGWAWLSIGCLTLALLMAFVFFISEKPFFKRLGFFSSALFIVAFIASMVFGYTALNDKQQVRFAIITKREVKIYEEPTADNKSKFSLHEGTRVRVLEHNTDWTNIKLENGNEGWMKTNELGLF